MTEGRPEPGRTLQSMEPPDPRFGVGVRTEGNAVVFALTGELDHDTAPVLRERFDEVFDAPAGTGAGTGAGAGVATEAGTEPPEVVVVDCAELGFCDSTGLNLLLTARLTAVERGIDIRLAGLHGHVVRMFEITGAGGVFSIHPDLAAALAAG
ncbi:STAS domain-containing protein [Streptacidiphilus sp. N1-12]|uniref:STAS domain-containing protein n=2 Tax=Streptacidiphilus alkalitolerans TaxID=3342712 RepID=A0ABV6VLR1_9ACTN